MTSSLVNCTNKAERRKQPDFGGDRVSKRLLIPTFHDENNNDIIANLICCACRNIYRNPKLLSCLHTFCKHCLESCVEYKAGGVYVKCPLCFTVKKIRNEEINGVCHDSASACLEDLTSDFVALNLLESYTVNSSMLDERNLCSHCSTTAQSHCSACAKFLCVNCQRAHKQSKMSRNHRIRSLALLRAISNKVLRYGDYCQTHAGQILTCYCKTCDLAVCTDCTFLDHPRDYHDVAVLSEVAPKQRRQLAELLLGVQQKVPFLKRTLCDIDSVLLSLPDHADAVAREITRNTEKFILALKEREEKLLQELTKLCMHKAKVLNVQKSKIASELQIYETSYQTSKKILRNGSDCEIAGVYSLVCGRLGFLREMNLDIEAEENAEFTYDSEADVLLDSIMNSGKISLIKSCSPLKMSGSGLQDATVGKYSSFTLAKSEHLDFRPSDVEIRIETPDSVLLACDVEKRGHLYNVVYNPKIPGEHEISVTVCGEHLADSPVCINVKEGHVMYEEKDVHCLTFGCQGSAPGYFDQPSDVAVLSSGHILVADTGNHRVHVLTAEGHPVSVFGKMGNGFGQLSYPAGIAISPQGHVIVTEHGNHRVQVFTSDGVYLRSFGGFGNSEGSMNRPTGIAVDEEGHMVVVDQQNHRLQVFDRNGVFQRQIGCHGDLGGQFNHPMYVAINQDGDIIVTDSENHRIQVFDSDGRFRYTFGRCGVDDGEFSYPTGIIIDASGYIIVSDRSGRLQVFSREMKFVTELQARSSSVDRLDCPMGIDFSPGGKIVVSDAKRHHLRLFYV